MRDELLRDVAAALERHEPEVVALQLPEGLKRHAAALSSLARERGATPVVTGDPCYGACDPAPTDLEALGVDLVIHVGHTSMEVDTLPTVHVTAEPDVDPRPAVRDAAPFLGDSAGIITTAQHLSSLDAAAATLREEGVEPEVADHGNRNTEPGQVLGCDLGNARVDAPSLLYLGTGLFHPLGAAITTGKDVVAADPFTGDAREVGPEAERFVRKRFGAVAGAAEAETWGVIVGRKPGQRRIPKAKEAAELLRESGREATLVTLDQVTPDALQNLGMDAYVNTACPRLSLEDSSRFDAPLLTPPELRLALGESDAYSFDEFER